MAVPRPRWRSRWQNERYGSARYRFERVGDYKRWLPHSALPKSTIMDGRFVLQLERGQTRLHFACFPSCIGSRLDTEATGSAFYTGRPVTLHPKMEEMEAAGSLTSKRLCLHEYRCRRHLQRALPSPSLRYKPSDIAPRP